jgi:hypothetical protein
LRETIETELAGRVDLGRFHERRSARIRRGATSWRLPRPASRTS